MMRRGTARTVATICVACLLCCSCTATIERVRQPNLEARIVRSDEGAVFVVSDSRDVYRVPAETIADIDHPGNVLMVVGAGLAVVTAMSLALAAGADGGKEALYTISGIYGATAAGLFAGGLIPYLRSTRAAANMDLSSARTKQVVTVPGLELVNVPKAPSMRPARRPSAEPPAEPPEEPGAP